MVKSQKYYFLIRVRNLLKRKINFKHKKKDNLEFSQEIWIAKERINEENVLNLVKKKNSSSKKH